MSIRSGNDFCFHKGHKDVITRMISINKQKEFILKYFVWDGGVRSQIRNISLICTDDFA